MDQLYEAMPIPSFSDEDDGHQGPSAPGEDDAAGMDLDVSARGSLSDSFASSMRSGTNGDSDVDDGDDKAETATGNPYHRVFTTSASPEDVFQFLMGLLRLADELHARLYRALCDDTSALSDGATPIQIESSPRRQQEPQQQSRGTSRKGKGVASFAGNSSDGDRCSCGAASSMQQARTTDGPLPHAFRSSGATCNGAAKLRGRLRKETDGLRRAVDGLRAAGCGVTDGSDGNSGQVDVRAIPPSVFNAAVTCAQCNSLSHFKGIITCLEREVDVTGVYVPMSGYVGPPQRRLATAPPSASSTMPRHGLSSSASSSCKPPFADNIRIEVDVVSSNEHRWIKLKTATARNLEMEAAALDINGSTPFTDMLLTLCERARRACLPHRRVAHVAVVFLHPPPPALQRYLGEHHVAWAHLSSQPSLLMPRGAHHPHRRAASVASWLPPVSFPPKLICLDTTALVALCSQSCFQDALPLEARLERLRPYHVLREQQRKEAMACAAVASVIEPELRAHTRWCTSAELNDDMRQALLREDEARDASATNRSSLLPHSLVQEVDLTWLPALQQAARESDETQRCGPLDESPLLHELSDRHARDATLRPNWIMADITFEEFCWILETIAGPEEIARAARLLGLVTVVRTDFLRERMRAAQSGSAVSSCATAATPGDLDKAMGKAATRPRMAEGCGASELSSTLTSSNLCEALFTSIEYLHLSGKVSLRNKIVFGLADAVEAVIITSNEQLCHAAREQGVCVDARFHPSRSLTELKMYQLRRRHGPGKPPTV